MVKLNKIYTRTGDDGTTGLVDGSRLKKHAARMVAIGDVDELNSALGGVLAEMDPADPRAVTLNRIQNDLFDLGADLATPSASGDFTPSPMELRIVAGQVAALEAAIDALNDELAPLTSFILPAGSRAVAALHLARSICRRAERAAVHAAEGEAINPHALTYLNRLSDYLFVAARHVAKGDGGEVLWVPGANR